MEKNYKKLCPFKGWVLENFPFIEADFDAITNYELLCKIIEYLNKTSSQFNDMIDNINYLNSWFNNLDVQDEVDNKLDEMAEAGTLQEIISEYLNSKAIFGYDTVDDMKAATNLIDGSYARTMGYYSINDGGKGLYKIRERAFDDVIDNGSIILMDDETLVAELIIENEIINAKQFGCKGDDETDDYIALNNAVQYSLTTNNKLYIPHGTYVLSNSIIITEGKDLYIYGDYGNFNQKVSALKSNNTPLIFYGALNTHIKGLYFISDYGIQFLDNSLNDQKHRVNNFYIEYCTFKTNIGISIDSICGYVYINYCNFTITEKGVEIGKNFANTSGVSANYVFIKDSQIRPDEDAETNTYGVDLQEGTFIFVQDTDLINLKYGISLDNLKASTGNVVADNVKFFQTEYAVTSTSNRIVQNCQIINSQIYIKPTTGKGIDISGANNRSWCICNNVFMTDFGSTILKIFNAGTRSVSDIFYGNTPPVMSNVFDYCTFTAQTDKTNLLLNSIRIRYLAANESTTVSFGSTYSWVKPTQVFSNYDGATITKTINSDGTVSVSVTNDGASGKNFELYLLA